MKGEVFTDRSGGRLGLFKAKHGVEGVGGRGLMLLR